MKRPSKNINRSLVIGNPTKDLDNGKEEAKIIAEFLNLEPLLRENATTEIVMELLPEVKIDHFATHAYFNPSDPLDSGIKLANGVSLQQEKLWDSVHDLN
jgi:CHAT domain-containing protein